MIPTQNTLLYDAALNSLVAHKNQVGRQFKGRFLQIFIGMKFHQNAVPSMFSNQFIATEVFQTLLDDLYAKVSRSANDAVLMLFEKSYLARTGLVGPKNTSSQNTWRNNFNLQKGVGCYAFPNDLASQTFLDQSRIHCKYLSVQNPGSLSGARCSLQLAGAAYRNEDHRKWLRIDPGGNGYAVVDLSNTSNFAPYVAPNNLRIPILPLIVALYHDASPGLVIGQRASVDIDDFRTDFNFSAQEFAAYFDDAPAAQGNAALLRRFRSVSYTHSASARRSPIRPQANAHRQNRPIRQNAPLLGTVVAPPATNSGFDAEQFASSALAANGWTVHNVSRQQLGYDFLVTKGRTTKYIEVKSSLGYCSPNLTSREWQQANAHGSAYVLAIIENFDPLGSNVIFWVPNPASSCASRQSQTVNYAISRSSWTGAAVAISAL